MFFKNLRTSLCCLLYVWTGSIATFLSKGCFSEFQSDLNISVECRYGIEDCSLHRLEVRFPDLYNKSRWGHDSPADLRAEVVCRKSETGIYLSWKPPQHHGAANIMGFEVHGGHAASDYRCFIIRLIEGVTQSKMASTFSGTIFPVESGVPYNVIVHSLPRSASSKSVKKTLVTNGCDKPLTSSSWTPGEFNISYSSDIQRLKVDFEAPPAEYNFRQFKLTLLSANNITDVTISQHGHIFKNVPPGAYDIRMQPVEHYPHDQQRCLCRDIQKRCDSCVQFQKEFVLSDALSQSSREPQKPTNEDPVSTIALVCASGFIVVLVAVLLPVVIIRRCRSKARDVDRHDQKKSSGADRQGTVFLLTDNKSLSNKEHRKLEKLINSLREGLANHVIRATDTFDVLNTYFKSRDRSNLEEQVDNKAMIQCRPRCVLCVVALSNDCSFEFNGIINRQQQLAHVDFINIFVSSNKWTNSDLISHSCFEKFDIERDYVTLVTFIKKALAAKDATTDSIRKMTEELSSDRLVVDTSQFNTYSTEYKKVPPKADNDDNQLGFEVPVGHRERYISRDSGNGESDSSVKSTSTEEFYSLSNNEQTCLLGDKYRQESLNVQRGVRMNTSNMQDDLENVDDDEHPFYEFDDLPRCPSGLFIPPDPSETSDCESRDFHIQPYCVMQHARTYDVCDSCVHEYYPDRGVFYGGPRHKMAPSTGSSMETLMNQLIDINTRSTVTQKDRRQVH